jgi:hypothetical protein
MITWPIVLTQRCANQDPKSVNIPLGVHLIHISYDCILSGEDWSLVGHLEKEGRLTVSEIQVLPVTPIKLTQEIPEGEAMKLIENQPWTPLDPVVSRPLGQISAISDPISFNWIGHGGKISWAVTLFMVVLVGLAIAIIVLCVCKRQQLKAKMGKMVHGLHTVHQESLQTTEEGRPTNTRPPSQVFVFGAPSGGQLRNPNRPRLYPTLETNSEPNEATTVEESWE